MAIFDGRYKQAGSLDAQHEGMILTYQAYLIAQQEADLASRQAFYQKEAIEDAEALAATHHTSTKARVDEKTSHTQVLPDFMQELLQKLIHQFKKMFQSHQDSIRSLVRELKKAAQKLGIEERQVDEFVANVDEAVDTALPVRDPDPIVAASAPPMPVPVLVPPRHIDPELEIGFSTAEARKAAEVKQKQEKAKEHIWTTSFNEFFAALLKPKEQRDHCYSLAVESLEKVTRDIVNEKFNHKLGIISLLNKLPAGFLQQSNNMLLRK